MPHTAESEETVRPNPPLVAAIRAERTTTLSEETVRPDPPPVTVIRSERATTPPPPTQCPSPSSSPSELRFSFLAISNKWDSMSPRTSGWNRTDDRSTHEVEYMSGLTAKQLERRMESITRQSRPGA